MTSTTPAFTWTQDKTVRSKKFHGYRDRGWSQTSLSLTRPGANFHLVANATNLDTGVAVERVVAFSEPTWDAALARCESLGSTVETELHWKLRDKKTTEPPIKELVDAVRNDPRGAIEKGKRIAGVVLRYAAFRKAGCNPVVAAWHAVTMKKAK